MATVVDYLVRYRWKIIEWCHGADQDPAEAADPSLGDIDDWLRENTGYGYERAMDAVDVARFSADDSIAPCSSVIQDCQCSDCVENAVPGVHSLPVVTGRLLQFREDLRWHIADTTYASTDHLVATVALVDEYLAKAHGLDDAQRHALSDLLDDGSLSFEQAVRALQLVAAQC